jgi:glutamine amidotransferase
LKKIVIVDYKLGNTLSLQRALSYLNFKSEITNDKKKILDADKVILPGVGAFPVAMNYLESFDLVNPLKEFSKKGNDMLGICLGMQLLMNSSNEFGYTKGLGLINGDVDIICNNENKTAMKLPSIGWYGLRKKKNDLIFSDIPQAHWFYFVHSYKVNCSSEENILATYNYSNTEIIAAVRDKNILGVQFHPENSGKEGLKVLNNFCNA